MKILSEDLRMTNPEAINDLTGYFEVEIYGVRGLMRDDTAIALFGTFEKTDHGTVLYSATVWADESGEIYHSYDSEFDDDLSALQKSNVRHLDCNLLMRARCS